MMALVAQERFKFHVSQIANSGSAPYTCSRLMREGNDAKNGW